MLSRFRFGAVGFYRRCRKCGEKSGTSEHNLIFGNKTAGRGCLKLGSGRQVSVFHRTSELVAHFALSKSPHSLKKFLKQP